MARALVDVRRATDDDVAAVMSLWTEGRDELVRQGRHSLPTDQVSARLTEAVATGQVEILLALREGRPTGFLILSESPLNFLFEKPVISVDQIFVTSSERRHGVARALLAHVAGRAERSGVDQIVTSVTPWARDMHRFFARLGFAPTTVRRSVATSTLRRRLAGDYRGTLEDLLSRRRSLRALARNRSLLLDAGDSVEAAEPDGSSARFA